MSGFAVQPHITNQITSSLIANKSVVAIIGDKPSVSAKSPAIWNRVFKELNVDAAYVPLDTSLQSLPALVKALKESDQILGFNVTMPYKIDVMTHLDAIDENAREIGAVNTVVRARDGKLTGYNTDGPGALDSLVKTMPGQSGPFLKSIAGFKVLLIGGGGAARAIAFSIAEAIGANGSILIANRDLSKAADLAAAIRKKYHNAKEIPFSDVTLKAPACDLIVNASTVGQLGIRKLANGDATCLEPYSALASSNPAVLPAGSFSDEASFYAKWNAASLPDIERNNKASLEIASRIPTNVAFFDAIFAPVETRFLSHARQTGKRTLNGRGMNIGQAADGFFNKIMKPYLSANGLDTPAVYQRVLQAMGESW